MYIEPQSSSNTGVPHKNDYTSLCPVPGSVHYVRADTDHLPPEIYYKKCDYLHLINDSEFQLFLEVGSHSNHGDYPGITGVKLLPHSSYK